jgi:glycosyltransferase involved in cell wall biosynthesis
MRITIVTGAFLPVSTKSGGAVEKRWLKMARMFAAWGHEVTMVSRLHPGLPATETSDGVAHRRIPGGEGTASALLLKFRDLLYTRRVLGVLPPADILVSNTFWLPLLAQDRSRGRVIVDVARFPKGQMRLYRRAPRLRAGTAAIRDAIVTEDPRARPRIALIPNPLPFEPPPDTDWVSKENTILFVGRIHPEKGVDLLVEAARGLPPGWSVEIIGPSDIAEGGGGEAYLGNLRERANGAPVRFLPAIHDPERLSEHYRKARIFAYPSLAVRGESFGLAPLEAMAWGCVPVVSDLACFRDFIASEQNGLVFEHASGRPGDNLLAALNRVIGEPGLSDRLSLAAALVRTTHAPERIARQFLDLFQEVSNLQDVE